MPSFRCTYVLPCALTEVSLLEIFFRIALSLLLRNIFLATRFARSGYRMLTVITATATPTMSAKPNKKPMTTQTLLGFSSSSTSIVHSPAQRDRPEVHLDCLRDSENTQQVDRHI